MTSASEGGPGDQPQPQAADAVLRTGRPGSFEEPRSVDQVRPRGPGWRQLDQPITVRCFLNNTWVDAVAVDVNDDTREVRIRWPPQGAPASGLGTHHEVLDASHYEPAPRLFG